MDLVCQYLLQPHTILFYMAIPWSILWKGIGLWHAARSRQLGWFVAILLINTVSILEILYVVFFRKDEQH